MMRAVADGRIGLSADVRHHLDLCLDCRACESACPSGVQYGRIIEPFKVAMQRSAEQEGITARAALEELEHERTLIAQAKTVLSELVARIDDPNDEAVPSRRSRKR